MSARDAELERLRAEIAAWRSAYGRCRCDGTSNSRASRGARSSRSTPSISKGPR